MGIQVIGYNSLLPKKFRSVFASVENGKSFNSGELECDRTSKYYPARSDEKIMRGDVIASIITVCEMLEKYSDFDENEIVDLYVANGVFIEDTSKHMDKVMAMYQQMDQAATELEKMKKLYQAIPPLLALQTLTNSTMSFIAQYANIKGNNTTYGNTSIAGFHAVEKAIYSLRSKRTGKAVVCASNYGGVHSFLTFSTIVSEYDKWKESSASASLILRKSDSEIDSLCRITELRSSKSNVSLKGKNRREEWLQLYTSTDADLVIFSGAFTENEYQRDEEQCKRLTRNCYSFFPQFGNLGSANIIMAIIKAIETIKSGVQKIDILDRDAYGRCSYLRIEK